MSQHMICVLRNLSGTDEFVPVSEVPFLNAGERMFSGQFNSQTEKHGPSGSHSRTVCTPAGQLIETTAIQCVLREVRPGDTQFRPVSDVAVLNDGERLFTGAFRTQRENNGPYGSHSMLVALPVITPFESRYSAAA